MMKKICVLMVSLVMIGCSGPAATPELIDKAKQVCEINGGLYLLARIYSEENGGLHLLARIYSKESRGQFHTQGYAQCKNGGTFFIEHDRK